MAKRTVYSKLDRLPESVFDVENSLVDDGSQCLGEDEENAAGMVDEKIILEQNCPVN